MVQVVKALVSFAPLRRPLVKEQDVEEVSWTGYYRTFGVDTEYLVPWWYKLVVGKYVLERGSRTFKTPDMNVPTWSGRDTIAMQAYQRDDGPMEGGPGED